MKDEFSLLSAYVDGEIESPWKEKFDQRIAEDPAWQAEVARLTQVKAFLHSQGEPNLAEAKDRIGHHLKTKLDLIVPEADAFHRRLSLSLPAVAAATLVLVLGGLYLGFSFAQGAGGPASVAQATADEEIQVQLPQKFNLKVNGEGRLLHLSNYQGSNR